MSDPTRPDATRFDPTDREFAIEVRDLTCRFGDFTAVDGVTFRVPTGSILGLLGPNGAGKTTIVRILATLLAPTSGRAQIFGFDVVKQAHAVRSLIGVTGQYASLDEDLNARENLFIFSRLNGLSRPAARRRSDELLEEFSLTDAANRPVRSFSGGMRRRLDLAASLISRPPLIFLDEPTTGLDPRTRVQMWDTVRRLVAAGSTVLLTTQYLDEADQLADSIAVFDHGQVVAKGSADFLKDQVAASTLRLVLQYAEERDRACEVVERVLGRPASPQEASALTAAMPDTKLAADVLIGLRDAGIDVAEVVVQKPSLDDVFFELTGRPREDTP